MGFYPHDISLYKIAFAHKSLLLKDADGRPLNNERLEFLGDAIIEAAVSDILFHHFKDKKEGFLTTTRSKLVQRETLGKLASKLEIDKFIQYSTNLTGHTSYLGGNAFEALVGAIYIDRGYKYCMAFLNDKVLSKYIDIDNIASKEVNFKSKLLEWTQKKHTNIEFRDLAAKNNADNSQTFTCNIVIEGIDCGAGEGFSKKMSQQKAAEVSLSLIRTDEKLREQIRKARKARIAVVS